MRRRVNRANNGIETEFIETAKVEQFDKVNTPFEGFALGDERLRAFESFSNVGLSEISGYTSAFEAVNEAFILS